MYGAVPLIMGNLFQSHNDLGRYDMQYIITNGKYYCKMKNKNAKIYKTKNVNEAFIFEKHKNASKIILLASSKLKGYYVVDRKKIFNKSKIKRKRFSVGVRKMIYDNADGYCKLCGRKIIYDDMTIDHIIPLAMNGTNDIENLQCSCRFCNSAKASILPEDFFDRITSIFMHQMEKKYADRLSWKLVKHILRLKYSL